MVPGAAPSGGAKGNSCFCVPSQRWCLGLLPWSPFPSSYATTVTCDWRLREFPRTGGAARGREGIENVSATSLILPGKIDPTYLYFWFRSDTGQSTCSLLTTSKWARRVWGEDEALSWLLSLLPE